MSGNRELDFLAESSFSDSFVQVEDHETDSEKNLNSRLFEKLRNKYPNIKQYPKEGYAFNANTTEIVKIHYY